MWCTVKCLFFYYTFRECGTFSTTSVTSVRTGDTFSSRRRLGRCKRRKILDRLTGLCRKAQPGVCYFMV